MNQPKENLWYYSEGTSENQSKSGSRKSHKEDHASILQEDYLRSKLENAGRNRNTKDSLFVVDWQMTDMF